MRILDDVIGLFNDLRTADDRLQVAMEEFFRRYYEFLKAFPRQGSRNLRLRRFRDREGRIRLIAWARRVRIRIRIGSRTLRAVRVLPGDLRAVWIYRIAQDWPRRERYFEVERSRRLLVRARQQVVKALRALRLGFLYAWYPKATPEDLARAADTVALHSPVLSSRDHRPIAGALALGREAGRIEGDLGRQVEQYRLTFRHRPEITFEPALTQQPSGRLRLSWGFPQVIYTREGARRMTEHVPGRPTDRWMREQGVPARLRKEIHLFIRGLLPLERRYGQVWAFLGRHRRRVRELAVRVAKLTTPFAGGLIARAKMVCDQSRLHLPGESAEPNLADQHLVGPLPPPP